MMRALFWYTVLFAALAGTALLLAWIAGRL